MSALGVGSHTTRQLEMPAALSKLDTKWLYQTLKVVGGREKIWAVESRDVVDEQQALQECTEMIDIGCRCWLLHYIIL